MFVINCNYKNFIKI